MFNEKRRLLAKTSAADWRLPLLVTLFPFTGEDGDAFCERLRWLGVETPPEFQRIAAQSFAPFTNHFLESRQFVGQRFITAFLLQARAQKV